MGFITKAWRNGLGGGTPINAAALNDLETRIETGVAEAEALALSSDSGSGNVIENVNTVATAGATQTLPDVTDATLHVLTLTSAACTLTFPTAEAGKSFTVVLAQDATGGRTVVWPGTILWPGDVEPTLTVDASSQDVFSFLCADGTAWLGFVRSVAAVPHPYRDAVLADSPISYWRLGEASGTAAADEQAAHTGTYTGGVTLGSTGMIASEADTAVSLDGTNDHVVVNATGGILAGRTNWTFEAWINTSTDNSTAYCERATSGNDILRILIAGNGRVAVTYRDDAAAIDDVAGVGMSVKDGVNHHIAVVKNGTAIRFFQDGAFIYATTLTASNTFTNASLQSWIGADTTGALFFNGRIDEVALYGTALSDARIAAHYAAATG